jgi:hypothetical protein
MGTRNKLVTYIEEWRNRRTRVRDVIKCEGEGTRKKEKNDDRLDT